MVKTTFSFKGGKELEAALAELGNKGAMKRTATRALARAAEPIRAEAERLAPIEQGDLKSAIKTGKAIGKYQKRGNRGDRVTTFVGIDESVNKRLHIYAGIEEFGKEHSPIQPYMRPAFEAKKEEARDRIADDLWDEISKTAARLAKKKAKGL